MFFASELSKCRKVKLLFGVLLGFSLFFIIVVFPLLWIFKAPIPKTDIDLVKEYVYYRLNFTPSTVKGAYFNSLQYIYPLYDETVKDEILFIKNNSIYQMFIVSEVVKEVRNPLYKVYGTLVRFKCKSTCEKLKEGKVKFFVKNVEGKFLLEGLNW